MPKLSTRLSLSNKRKIFKDYRIIIYLYIITFFIVMPLLCVNLPYSAYHVIFKSVNQAIQDRHDENLKRVIENQRIIRDLRHDDLKRDILSRLSLDSLNNSVEIGITIITTSRDDLSSVHDNKYQPSYLTQVVGKLLQLVTDDQSLHERVKVFVCNVDTRPDLHREINSLRGLVPVFTNHTKSSHPWHLHVSKMSKENWDYIYCMSETIKRVNSYALILQDDAYPKDDLLSALTYLIDIRLPLIKQKAGSENMEAAYFKLYHPFRVLGYWSIEYDRIPELISFAIFFGSCAILTTKHFSKFRHLSVHALWGLFCVYFLLIGILIGRQNLLELRRLCNVLYILSPAPQCCIPGVLYPKRSAQRMVDYLSSVTCTAKFPIDFAMYKFLRLNPDLTGYMLQPNTLQHIGLHTTLHSGIGNPFEVD